MTMPAKAGQPPFRADHIGSLLRPPQLRQAFREHAAKKLSDQDFTAVLDSCIRDVITMQEDAGLKVVTDGEFRRASYWSRFVERIGGFSIRPAEFKFRNDQGEALEFTGTYAQRRLSRDKALALDEFVFVRDIARAAPKITLPAPSTMHFYRSSDFADPAVYRDPAAFR